MTKALAVAACLLLVCSGLANAQRADYFGNAAPQEKAQIGVPTPSPSGVECSAQCPPSGIPEGEPACSDGYVDATNGGCNSTPAVFSVLECEEPVAEVCGTYGNYAFEGLDYRDTDWYQFTIDQAQDITVCVCGSAATQLAIVNADCGALTLACGSVFGNPNEPICCGATLPAGTYWIFVATSAFTGSACGSPYLLSVRGLDCGVVGVEASQWSKVKNIYR